ncbi:MAG: sigma-70 family RNA polymerase sigma factor, partial [Polyangiales bacterium]
MDGSIAMTTQEAAIREQQTAGDLERATALLLDSYGPEIFRYLVARLRESHAAEEAYSEFAYDLWRGLLGFRWSCSARAWAY